MDDLPTGGGASVTPISAGLAVVKMPGYDVSQMGRLMAEV